MNPKFSSRSPRIPRFGTAVLKALQFSAADSTVLESLSDAEWQKALAFCDSARLTLTLSRLCHASLPVSVRLRVERNHRDNAARFALLEAALFEIADCFDSHHIEFALLKGFAHSPDFTPDPLLRAQSDLDLWCPPETILAARDLMLGLGYIPVTESHGRHLAPMVRDTNWRWRNDYFAKDLPMPVEIHHALWDEKMERIPGAPEPEFWNRRVRRSIGGRTVHVLAPPDALAFAALHLLMHLLHGDLVLHRAWELAYFIESHASDIGFWEEWRRLHPSGLRALEAVAVALAAEWFACAVPATVQREIATLPSDIKLWLRHFAWSPVEGLFSPNKDEVWLNLCLLACGRDRTRVFFRRLVPLSVPRMRRVKANRPKLPKNCRKSVRITLSRCVHHLRTFVLTLMTGFKWWWLRALHSA